MATLIVNLENNSNIEQIVSAISLIKGINKIELHNNGVNEPLSALSAERKKKIYDIMEECYDNLERLSK